MLSRLAHALLVATSLSPILLVHGVTRWHADRLDAARWLAVAALLVLLCLLLLVAARGGLQRRPVELTELASQDREVLAFLVSYALPLVTPVDHPAASPALVTFVVLVGLVLYQTGLVHVNPVLGLLGYRFFEVKASSGEAALLLTRSPSGRPGSRQVVQLSERLWLQVEP